MYVALIAGIIQLNGYWTSSETQKKGKRKKRKNHQTLKEVPPPSSAPRFFFLMYLCFGTSKPTAFSSELEFRQLHQSRVLREGTHIFLLFACERVDWISPAIAIAPARIGRCRVSWLGVRVSGREMARLPPEGEGGKRCDVTCERIIYYYYCWLVGWLVGCVSSLLRYEYIDRTRVFLGEAIE